MSRILSILVFVGLVGGIPSEFAFSAEPARIYVTLWWDTEDYVLPASDDAALRVARWLSQQKIRATFKVVGEKARTLERRRRTDVIDALKQHEIGYHSNYHSVQPTPAMYLSELGWDEGVAEFDRRERPGLDDVKRVFGQHPSCYGQPGSSWGPQSLGALKKWNVPVYLDSGNHLGVEGRPFFYCGIVNFYNLTHTLRTNLGGIHDLKQAEQRFLESRKKLLQEGGGVVSVYYHPCEFVHRQFWDGVNFARGANPPLEQLKLPPAKTEAESATAYETFESFIRFIAQFPEVRFVTASELARIYRDKSLGKEFSKAALTSIAGHLDDSITYQRWEDCTLSVAETLLLLSRSLNDLFQRNSADGAGKLTFSPLGPTSPSIAMTGPVSAPRHQFERTLTDVLDYLEQHGRVPSVVWLGSVPITPEAFLATLARVYRRVVSGEELGEEIEFRPATLAAAKHVAEDDPRLWRWVIFPEGFRAPAMMELARWQAWTIKPAILHGLENEP